MLAEMITICGDNDDVVSAYTAHPTGRGPFPDVALIRHLPGWDELYRKMTRKFAHHGYAAISHNLYERIGQGVAGDLAAKARAEGGATDSQVVADTEAAVQWLEAQHFSPGKVEVIGSCSGARPAFRCACNTRSIDAVADLWGGRVVQAEDDRPEKQPVQPLDMTPDLSCPPLHLCGKDDRAPSPEQVGEREERLKKHGKEPPRAKLRVP